MAHFLGILEQKGLDAISEYARLIAEVLNIRDFIFIKINLNP
jgi:hypothetical protein